MRLISLSGILICVLSLSVHAEGSFNDVTDFLGAHGCALGPESRSAAVKAGIDPVRIDSARAWAIAAGKASVQREWVILSDDFCKIRLPDFAPEVSVVDPEVQDSLWWITQSEVDAEADKPDPLYTDVDIGCFVYPFAEKLAQRPGWNEDRAFMAYLQFLGRGHIQGDIRFMKPARCVLRRV